MSADSGVSPAPPHRVFPHRACPSHRARLQPRHSRLPKKEAPQAERQEACISSWKLTSKAKNGEIHSQYHKQWGNSTEKIVNPSGMMAADMR